jgi:hypothetical protein
VTPNASLPLSANYDEIKFVLDQTDAHLQGWTYWDMGSLYRTDTGKWDLDAMLGGQTEGGLPLGSGFVRPFAQAVAGVLTSMHFDAETGIFELLYEADPSLGAPTEIACPDDVFPQGFGVELSNGGMAWEMSSTRPGVVLVTATEAGPVSVLVTRQ